MKGKFVYFLFLYYLAGCMEKPPSVKTGLEGQPIPPINLLLMDSLTRLNTSSIPSDKPIVLVLFSPFCPYCKAQTTELIDKIKNLTNIRIYLLSSFPFDAINSYYKQYKLKNYPTITVAQDYEAYSNYYFKANAVPYIAIYNKDKHLNQVLIGKVKAELIETIALK